jgi:hypothetical protein
MAAGTKVGTGYVSVEPDFTGFQDAVERAMARRLSLAGDKAGQGISEGIRKRIARDRDGFGLAPALGRLKTMFGKVGDDAGEQLADRIGKGANRAEADVRGLAGAVADVETRVRAATRSVKGLDAMSDFFASKAGSPRGGLNRSVADALGLDEMSEFFAEAKKAPAKLSPLERASRRLRVHAQSLTGALHGVGRALSRSVASGARSATGGFGGLNGTMARANRTAQFFRNVMRLLRFPAIVTGVGLLTQGLSALAAGFTAAASAAGPLAGALVAMPALAATAAQAFGALKLATAGVGDTIKAALDAQVKGGSQAVDTMGQQRAAADRVADAELAVADAQRQTKLAQEDLTAARKEARRELQDMELAAARTGNTEEAAVLRIKEARKQLLETALDTDSTELDIQLDENALEAARFDLQQTRIEAKRTRADYKDAADEGLKGMPAIVAARRAEADASRAETAAQRDLQRAVEASTVAMASQGGAADKLAEEMGQLPPAAQAFVRQIISMKPKLDELRATAASGLFPGVTTGLKGLMGNFGVVNQLVAATSGAFGGLAAKAGKALGGKEWGRDLALIGGQNVKTINQMGEAGGNLADTFRHILVAARPFVNWIGKGTVALTGWMKTSSKAGRENGKLAAFFDRTKKSMQLLGPILKGVGGSLLNIGKAARPLGNEILGALGKSAEGFRKWTGSVEGQNSLKKYFADAKPAIFEMGRLLRDVTKAFFTLGNQPGAAKLIKQVRTELLPALTDVVGTLTKHFGPALIDALTAGAKLLQSLSHETGPLTVVVKALGAFAKALTWVIEHVPAVKVLVSSLLVLKGLSLASSILGVTRLAGAVRALPPIFAAAGAQAGGGFATAMKGRMVAAGPGIAAGLALVIGPELQRRFDGLLGGLRLDALKPNVDTDEGKAAAIDFKILRQEILKGKLSLGALREEFKRYSQEAMTPEMRRDLVRTSQSLDRLKTNFGLLRSGALGSLKDIEFFSKQSMGVIRRVLGRDTKAGREAAAQNLRLTARAFRIEMQRSGDWTEAAMRRHRRLINRADLAGAGRKQAAAFGREWAAGMTHGNVLTQKGMDGLTKTMIGKMRKMRPGVRQAAFDAWNEQVKQAEKSGGLTGKQADRMRTRVLKSFDGLVLGAKDKAPKWADKVIANNARMTNVSSNAFGTLVDNANSALSAFGVIKKLEYKAKKFAAPGEAKKQTGGFIVPGQGSGDSFHTALPVGSFVMNRNATERFGLQRGGLAPVALEPRERVFAPDEVKKVGRRKLEAMNAAVPRFQTGGMVRVPGDPPGPYPDTVNKSVAGLAAQFVRKFKLNISAAFNPGGSHKSPGHKVTGTAIDIIPGPGGDWGLVGKAVAAAVQRGLTVYYDGSFGSTALSNHGPGNHAHIELGGSGGALPIFDGLDKLALTGPAGALRDMGQAAMTKVRRAGDRLLTKEMMTFGGGDMFSPFGGLQGLGGNAAENRALGQKMAERVGWVGPQWAALDHLWGVDESGWDEGVANYAGSGAYGIAQALPASKYPPAGRPEAPNGPEKAKAQIAWGLQYIRERYGDPLAADAFRHANNWYQKGGLVRMVGDSLGVGTEGQGGLAGRLKALGFGLNADNRENRTSAQGAGLFGGNYKQAIFDLGTNDLGDIGMFRGSLKRVRSLVGDRPWHALTMLGAGAQQKNAALRSSGANVIDWAKVAGPYVAADSMGLHPTAGGYGWRASKLTDSVRKAAAKVKRAKQQDNSRKKAGRDPKGPEVTDLSRMNFPKALRESMKLVRNPKAKKRVRSKQVEKLVNRLKAQFDLPPGWREDLLRFEANDAKFSDRAGRADEQTFDVMDDDGEPVIDAEGRQVVSLGRMDGRTAEDWARDRLGNLINWRNKLIDARVKVIELFEQVKAQIAERQRRVNELTPIIEKQFALKGHLDNLHGWVRRPKINGKKIEGALGKIRSDKLLSWMPKPKEALEDIKRAVEKRNRPWLKDRLGDVAGRWQANRREKSALVGEVIPALVDRRGALGADRGEFESQLTTVQGPGYGMELADKFGGFPTLGQWSGSIFDAHSDLNRFSEKPPFVQKDKDEEPDHSRNLDRELFGGQYGIKALEELQKNISAGMQRLLPNAGVFHTGGIVPGQVGQERAATVLAGEGVFTREQMAALQPVNTGRPEDMKLYVIVEDGAVDDSKIRVLARDEAGREYQVQTRRERGVMRQGVAP